MSAHGNHATSTSSDKGKKKGSVKGWLKKKMNRNKHTTDEEEKPQDRRPVQFEDIDFDESKEVAHIVKKGEDNLAYLNKKDDSVTYL